MGRLKLVSQHLPGDVMVILRPTRKLRTPLPVSPDAEPQSDTALGDWYVNRVVIYRRPLLLLVSSASLLAVLIPARDVKILPDRLAEIIAQRLARLGVPRKPIDAELEAMTPLHVAPTSDRSVLGIMIDYAKMLPGLLEPGFSDHSGLMEAEELLWDNPCYAGKPAEFVIFPRRKTSELLLARPDAG